MEARLKSKMTLRPKLRYMPTKGTLGIRLRSTIGLMPSDRTPRSLDASLAIPTRVLRLEASGALRPQIGQTGSPNRSGRFWPDSHARSSASALWLSRVTGDFLVNHRKPRELDVASIITHDLASTKLSHLILQGKPNASHMCARINLHTHDRQKSVIPLQ
jgi:hypothetical protein